MSDLSQSTVSNLYNRNYDPTFSTLENLCNGFGIALSEFFNENNEAVFLTDDQKTLLELWARLSPKQRKSLINFLDEV